MLASSTRHFHSPSGTASEEYFVLPPQLRKLCVWKDRGRLNGRIRYFLYARGLINANQYGFTRERSSVMALNMLKQQLLGYKNTSTPALLMSIVFHGAFDSVWHPHVLRYFRNRCLPSGLYHLLRTLLEVCYVFFNPHAGQVEA